MSLVDAPIDGLHHVQRLAGGGQKRLFAVRPAWSRATVPLGDSPVSDLDSEFKEPP
jgi:ABC-type lipoprotein export system ATPase subunit